MNDAVELRTYYLNYGAHFTVERKDSANVYGRWNYSDGDVIHGSMSYERFFEQAVAVLDEPVVLYGPKEPVPWAKHD